MKQEKTHVRSKRSNEAKHPVRQNRLERSSKYNYKDMKDDTVLVHREFAGRLSAIRAAKGISAREMSLSLGQGAGYINNIENGRNLPSMSMFLEICEYLEISPMEFFNFAGHPVLHESSEAQLLYAFAKLGKEEQELVIKLVETLRRDTP